MSTEVASEQILRSEIARYQLRGATQAAGNLCRQGSVGSAASQGAAAKNLPRSDARSRRGGGDFRTPPATPERRETAPDPAASRSPAGVPKRKLPPCGPRPRAGAIPSGPASRHGGKAGRPSAARSRMSREDGAAKKFSNRVTTLVVGPVGVRDGPPRLSTSAPETGCLRPRPGSPRVCGAAPQQPNNLPWF